MKISVTMASSSILGSPLEEIIEKLQSELDKVRMIVSENSRMLWGIDEGAARRLDLLDKDLIRL